MSSSVFIELVLGWLPFAGCRLLPGFCPLLLVYLPSFFMKAGAFLSNLLRAFGKTFSFGKTLFLKKQESCDIADNLIEPIDGFTATVHLVYLCATEKPDDGRGRNTLQLRNLIDFGCYLRRVPHCFLYLEVLFLSGPFSYRPFFKPRNKGFLFHRRLSFVSQYFRTLSLKCSRPTMGSKSL